MSNNKQLSELATIYRELPEHKQKQATDYIKKITGKSRGTVWNWTRGNSRIPFESIENQIIKYMKGLQNDTTGIN